ncbi:hypothetical protein HDE_06068 [Halotydeus destructor]|nr:hypothetical protein HDE_06068 [Halotydeus destructor]
MSHLWLVLTLWSLVAICSSCPQGWKNVADRMCVKFFPFEVHHAEAKQLCASYDAILLTIDEEDEWHGVKDLAAFGHYKSLWTSDSEPVTSDLCFPSMAIRPDNKCPVYVIDHDEVKKCISYCNGLRSFACEKPFVAGPGLLELPVTGYSCPSHFVAWDKHCYQFLAGTSGSHTECSDAHDAGDLVIGSKLEEDFIVIMTQHLGYGPQAKLWIDVTCSKEACKYRDNKSPIVHDKINYLSCSQDDDDNEVYWDLKTNEWACVGNDESDSEFYSVCKLAGLRNESVEIGVPVLPSVPQHEEPVKASAVVFGSSLLFTLMLLLFSHRDLVLNF